VRRRRYDFAHAVKPRLETMSVRRCLHKRLFNLINHPFPSAGASAALYR